MNRDLVNPELQQCATDYAREQCGDEMVSLGNELIKYIREDLCQQQTPSDDANSYATDEEGIIGNYSLRIRIALVLQAV